MNKPVPYTIEPEYKAPTVASLALDLLLAVVGAAGIIGGCMYALGLFK